MVGKNKKDKKEENKTLKDRLQGKDAGGEDSSDGGESGEDAEADARMGGAKEQFEVVGNPPPPPTILNRLNDIESTFAKFAGAVGKKFEEMPPMQEAIEKMNEAVINLAERVSLVERYEGQLTDGREKVTEESDKGFLVKKIVHGSDRETHPEEEEASEESDKGGRIYNIYITIPK